MAHLRSDKPGLLSLAPGEALELIRGVRQRRIDAVEHSRGRDAHSRRKKSLEAALKRVTAEDLQGLLDRIKEKAS